MISQTAEYALRAVTHLAYNDGSPQTNRQISDSTMVPPAYLSKVLQALARARLIRSLRGARGGFALAKAPDAVTVLDVVNAVDPLPRIHSCPLGLAAHGEILCPLHRRLDCAMEAIETAFRDSTIADIIAEPSASRPLCAEVPSK